MEAGEDASVPTASTDDSYVTTLPQMPGARKLLIY
jgi:hypothetical protein